jgi:prevent-host-death family protein
MTVHVGVRELRDRLSSYLERARAGEQIEITDRGRPIAMLVPLPESRVTVAELIAAGKLRFAERTWRLVIDEPESGDLEAWLGAQPEPVVVSSVLARTEVLSAIARTDPDAAHLALDLLAAVSVVELDVSLADEAARLDPAELRSLDAVHLASALRLGPALGSMVSYDERILDAAKRHGVAVAHPGWPPMERSPSS